MRTLPTVRNLTSRQGGDLTPTVAVPPSLQRACACGGSAGLTGECEDCKTKKLLGQQIQPKLTIGSPNDEYEQEADRVADQVMRMPEDGSQFEGIDQPDIASKRVARTPILQREGEGESPPPAEPAKPKEEESSCPSWRADPDSISKRAAEFYARNHMTPTSQATVERINCEAPIANGNYGCYVHFSDGLVLRVIVRQTDIVVGTGPGPITTEHPPAATPLCFYDYSCPDGQLVLTVKRCQSAKPSRSVGPPAVAQRKPDSAGTHPAIAPPAVHDVLTAPGQPLDRATRAYFEPRFGYDFGKVRIHADTAASISARAVHAKAYAVGSDIVFAAGHYEPNTARGRELIAHELCHVVQQTGTSGSSLVKVGAVPLRVARAVDDWLVGSVNIGAWTYTQLVSELDELQQYLDRQTSSSADTVRIEEAIEALRAEIARRNTTAALSRTRMRARGRGRRGAVNTAPRSTEPLPARYPRILTEMTSVTYTDPADMRAEYDLIMQWLERPNLSASERKILSAERKNLEPQLTADRQRVIAERHAERVRLALTPTETGNASELVELTRTILGIAPDESNPGIAYIYHRGERVAISTEQARTLRDTLRDQLLRASRRIESRIEYAWGRYTAQVAINDDHPIISSIAGFLGDVDDPGDDLLISYQTCRTRVRRMQRLIQGGSILEAAQLVPRAEAIAGEISEMAARYYEGYIEGAERAVHGLEFTRDASFAVAGSIAAVVAAPVVAGAVGAGGLGLTGASATAATVGGTGLVVGTGMAGVRGTSAAGGVLLAGGSLDEASAAFTTEAWRGFREGFLTGAGGAAARSVGLAINAAGGSLAGQVATRVGAEMLINGTTTMIEVLARGGSIEDAARAGLVSAAQAAPGALLGGSNNPVVRNLLAPFTAGGTAYLAARANGATSDEALAQAGVAVATNVAMSRAAHSPEADSALVERGRSIASNARTTVASATRRAAPYAAAVMVGVSDAVPPARSGFGATAVPMENDLGPGQRVNTSSRTTSNGNTSAETRPSTTAATSASSGASPAASSRSPAVSIARRESAGARSTARASSSARPEIEEAARMGFIDPAIAAPGASVATATSRTPRSHITAIRAQTAEATAYDARLSRGEIGLLAPVGANVPGADYATAVRLPNGEFEIVVIDAKSRVSSASDFGDVRTSLPTTWIDSVRDAIAPSRLILGDPTMEQAIRDAWTQGRVRIARDTIDYSSSGQGQLRLDN